MAEVEKSFTIADELSVPENLTVFAAKLVAMDAALGGALAPHLQSLAGQPGTDPTSIWNALYAATKPVDKKQDSTK